MGNQETLVSVSEPDLGRQRVGFPARVQGEGSQMAGGSGCRLKGAVGGVEGVQVASAVLRVK